MTYVIAFGDYYIAIFGLQYQNFLIMICDTSHIISTFWPFATLYPVLWQQQRQAKGYCNIGSLLLQQKFSGWMLHVWAQRCCNRHVTFSLDFVVIASKGPQKAGIWKHLRSKQQARKNRITGIHANVNSHFNLNISTGLRCNERNPFVQFTMAASSGLYSTLLACQYHWLRRTLFRNWTPLANL